MPPILPPKLLVLCGPTASGKTALAVALALQYNGEVVSADSMQIYRGMDIGTAKPTPAERQGVPHHMLDVADPGEDYSVARYVAAAAAAVDDILARGRLPILAGGTGLYIDSLLDRRDFAPLSGAWRKSLQAQVAAEGLPALYAQLAAIDPQRAQRLHPNDEKRILRALEVWHETGETISEHDARTRTLPPRYRALRIGLNYENRADLKARIDGRVDHMLDAGLAEEVAGLLRSGVPSHSTAMQAIGYKELTAALAGREHLTEAADRIRLRSRQYAKRQLTWLRRNDDTRWILWGKTPDFSAGRQKATAFMEEFGLP